MAHDYTQFTFPYTLNELVNPQGRNALATGAKFFQRTMYREAIYPDHAAHLPRPLDTWYDKNLFGRVDRCQNTIVPVGSNLKTVRKAATSNIYCLNFVELAFDALVSHMGTAAINGCMSTEGTPAIWDMKAVRGYVDPHQKYKAFLDGLIDAFANEHVDTGQNIIKNFDDFVPIFKNYILYIARTYPITKENFFLSNVVSPYMTGLSLAISRHSAADDAPKYQDYINDVNFDYYIKSAKEYGFLVNKNMPWVLTADLFTNAIQRYMNYYLFGDPSDPVAPDKTNLFELYYDEVYRSAFDNLRYVFAYGYYRFRQQKPLYSERKVIWKQCHPAPVGASQGRVIEGSLTEHNFFRKYYGDITVLEGMLKEQFLIDLYIDLRHIESRESHPSKSNVKARAYQVYGAQLPTGQAPMHDVLEFVNEVYRIYLYPSNYGDINLTTNLDKLLISDIMDTGVEIAATPRCTSATAAAVATPGGGSGYP